MNISSNGLSDKNKSELDAIAQIGFLFCKALEDLPDEVSILYAPYFKKRGQRKILIALIKKFCSITLAIKLGHSAEDREIYLINKRNQK